MLRQKHYYVYILSNASRLLYIGVTNNLRRRLDEHRQKLVPGFTRKYNLHWLAYYETYRSVRDALRREKQLKKWRRSKKIELIERENPHWKNLSAEWEE